MYYYYYYYYYCWTKEEAISLLYCYWLEIDIERWFFGKRLYTDEEVTGWLSAWPTDRLSLPVTGGIIYFAVAPHSPDTIQKHSMSILINWWLISEKGNLAKFLSVGQWVSGLCNFEEPLCGVSRTEGGSRVRAKSKENWKIVFRIIYQAHALAIFLNCLDPFPIPPIIGIFHFLHCISFLSILM